jgi:hypothetical protein
MCTNFILSENCLVFEDVAASPTPSFLRSTVELPLPSAWGETVNVKRLSACCQLSGWCGQQALQCWYKRAHIPLGLSQSKSNSNEKLSGIESINSGMNTPCLLIISQCPGFPSMVTVSPDALVFHLSGKSPTASCAKSSYATIFSPGTKSYLL